MTRDGAVLDNQTTGEEIHISERAAEKQQDNERDDEDFAGAQVTEKQ